MWYTTTAYIVATAVTLSQAQPSNQQTMATETHKMTIARTFNAPVEKVWNAWKDSASVMRWWGPMGFTCPVAKMNFKVGNSSLVCMRSPDGFEIYNSWTYTKIEPMKSIEFIQHFTNAGGKKISPSDIGLPPGIPDEVPHMITFKDGGKGTTEITIIESGYANAQVVEMSKGGMASVLDKLAAEVEMK
jgi:uncharacterized protein YndB with AHSA1/START domain